MDNNRPFAYAVRIYLKDGYEVMADIALGDGGRPNGVIETIEWDNINERSKYVINAYTFIWDERHIVKTYTFYDYATNQTPK